MRQPSGTKICFGRRTGFKGERGEVGVTQAERLGAKTGGKNKNNSRGKKSVVLDVQQDMRNERKKKNQATSPTATHRKTLLRNLKFLFGVLKMKEATLTKVGTLLKMILIFIY